MKLQKICFFYVLLYCISDEILAQNDNAYEIKNDISKTTSTNTTRPYIHPKLGRIDHYLCYSKVIRLRNENIFHVYVSKYSTDDYQDVFAVSTQLFRKDGFMLEENFRSFGRTYYNKLKIKLIKMEELETDGTIVVYIILYQPVYYKEFPNHCTYIQYIVNSQGLKLTADRDTFESAFYNIDQSILLPQQGGGWRFFYLTNLDAFYKQN
jgi:hypothetical protein